jgi:hypothetical protein
MSGDDITFETIHQLIENPTNDQKADHVVAFVKRAYFQVIAGSR